MGESESMRDKQVIKTRLRRERQGEGERVIA